MTERLERPVASIRLSVGAFEVTITSVSKDELSSMLEIALEAIDANIEKVRSLMEKVTKGQPITRGLSQGQPDAGLAELSIGEFVRRTNRKKGTDVGLAIAYYLFKVRGLGVINTKDLNGAYDEARLPKLTNPTDTLNTLVRSGRMKEGAEKDNLKGFTITQSGETEVDGWLNPKP